jgi:hypothetical protein
MNRNHELSQYRFFKARFSAELFSPDRRACLSEIDRPLFSDIRKQFGRQS